MASSRVDPLRGKGTGRHPVFRRRTGESEEEKVIMEASEEGAGRIAEVSSAGLLEEVGGVLGRMSVVYRKIKGTRCAGSCFFPINRCKGESPFGPPEGVDGWGGVEGGGPIDMWSRNLCLKKIETGNLINSGGGGGG